MSSKWIAYAYQGAIPWIAYGVVEVLILVVLRYFVTSADKYIPYRADVTLLVLAIYALCGGLLGAALGLFQRRTASAEEGRIAMVRVRVWSTVSVLLACVIEALSSLPHAWPSPEIWIYAIPLAATLLGLKAASQPGRLQAVSNPWTIALLTLTLPSVQERMLHATLFVKLGSLLIASVLILSISIAVQSLTGRWRATMTSAPLRPQRDFLIACALAFFTSGFCLVFQPRIHITSRAQAQPARDRPNVILITMDTVRADHLSVYGYERNTTPNLQNFARNATIYTMAVCNGDMTLASHGSLFTGVYPTQQGAHFDQTAPWGQALNHRYRTMAELLEAAGFQTIGVIANMGYLTDKFGLDRGFTRYDPRMAAAGLPILFPKHFLRDKLRELLEEVLPSSELFRPYRRGDKITQSALMLLEQAAKDRPVFLFLNYMDAHYPYIPPAPFDGLFPGKARYFAHAQYAALQDGIYKRKRKIQEQERRHLISQYDGGIAYVDHQLGALFARLKEMGLYDNSLILVTSDHGEIFGERDLFAHGVSVYQDQIHVPLIVKYPGQRKEASVDTPVSGVDLLPTVLDVLGYAVPAGVQGTSLLRLNASAQRSIISESYPGGPPFFGDARFNRIERSVLAWPLKLVSSTTGKRELYNLQNDPVEVKNVYAPEDPASKLLQEGLAQWARSTATPNSGKTVLDRDTLQSLKSLGYVQ